MDYVEKFFDSVQSALNINPSTFSGAIDIVVVQQSNGEFSDDSPLTNTGSFKSTPFHVRFGKFQVLNAGEKTVTLAINDHVSDIKMKLGDSGSAYFVREVGQVAVHFSLANFTKGSPSCGASPLGPSPLSGTPTNDDPAVCSLRSQG